MRTFKLKIIFIHVNARVYGRKPHDTSVGKPRDTSLSIWMLICPGLVIAPQSSLELLSSGTEELVNPHDATPLTVWLN